MVSLLLRERRISLILMMVRIIYTVEKTDFIDRFGNVARLIPDQFSYVTSVRMGKADIRDKLK